MQKLISLSSDIIDEADIETVIAWLRTNPQLTKGERTRYFESKFSEYLGCKHSIYCNSGSSANLLIVSALQQLGILKNNKVIVPQLSWATTLFPVMQLGLTPVLCDCSKDNLGLDIDDLYRIIEEEEPAAIMLVHVLGFSSSIVEIRAACEYHNIILIEDTCESLGSEVNGQKLGTFGLAGSFSFYFGHHISTIEGGMICTNDTDLADMLKMLRSHGWDRDLSPQKQQELRTEHDVNNFGALYKFYHAGFNCRATDLQAVIGINQMEKLQRIISSREKNYHLYRQQLNDNVWKPVVTDTQNVVSNMGYPLATPNRDEVVAKLHENKIDYRPIISGSMGMQPVWVRQYGIQIGHNSSYFDDYGLYVPNNQDLTEEEIARVCSIVNDASQS